MYIFLLFLNLYKASGFIIELEPFISIDSYTNRSETSFINDPSCGISQSDRIIGGHYAELGQYPWIVRLGYNMPGRNSPVFSCGGTIISNRYVVTAAHCVQSLVPYIVRAGELNTLTNPDCDDNYCAPEVEDYLIEEVLIHEDYDMRQFDSDIALIRVDRPIVFNSYVAPICLEHDELLSNTYEGAVAESAGWGLSNPDPRIQKFAGLSHSLQTVNLKLISNDLCEYQLINVAPISSSQLCGAAIQGIDTCNGDSGGPLVIPLSSASTYPKYYLIGIVSFGSEICGTGEMPSVFTRVSKFIPWIVSNMHT